MRWRLVLTLMLEWFGLLMNSKNKGFQSTTMTFSQNFCGTGVPVTLDTLTKLLQSLYSVRKSDPQTADEVFILVNQLFPASPTTLEQVIAGLGRGGRRGLWFTIRANPLETPAYKFDPQFLQNNPLNRNFVSPFLTFIGTYTVVTRGPKAFCPGAKGSIVNYGQ